MVLISWELLICCTNILFYNSLSKNFCPHYAAQSIGGIFFLSLGLCHWVVLCAWDGQPARWRRRGVTAAVNSKPWPSRFDNLETDRGIKKLPLLCTEIYNFTCGVLSIYMSKMTLDRPNCFGRIQIVLVGSKSFCSGPNHFVWVQIILVRFKLEFCSLIFIIWTCPKWFETDQNKMDWFKMIVTWPKWLLLNQDDSVYPKSLEG